MSDSQPQERNGTRSWPASSALLGCLVWLVQSTVHTCQFNHQVEMMRKSIVTEKGTFLSMCNWYLIRPVMFLMLWLGGPALYMTAPYLTTATYVHSWSVLQQRATWLAMVATHAEDTYWHQCQILWQLQRRLIMPHTWQRETALKGPMGSSSAAFQLWSMAWGSLWSTLCQSL